MPVILVVLVLVAVCIVLASVAWDIRATRCDGPGEHPVRRASGHRPARRLGNR